MKNKMMLTAALLLLALVVGAYGVKGQKNEGPAESLSRFDSGTDRNGQKMIAAGRQTFRFDTFGDQAFWGDTLQTASGN